MFSFARPTWRRSPTRRRVRMPCHRIVSCRRRKSKSSGMRQRRRAGRPVNKILFLNTFKTNNFNNFIYPNLTAKCIHFSEFQVCQLQSDGLRIRRRLVYGRWHVDEAILSIAFVLFSNRKNCKIFI